MEGINGALARITELQGRLSTLRAPAPPVGFDALLRQAPAAQVAGARTEASPGTALPGPAWAAAQRPASLTGAPSSAASASRVGASAALHPNGRLPDAALTDIGGGERLVGPAAAGFATMRAAAARDGVELPVNDSYRSLAEQEDVARRKGLYSEGGLAARPGTSTHGHGLSVDLQLDSRALAWMREHGGRFGFVEDVPREPWHWTFRGA